MKTPTSPSTPLLTDIIDGDLQQKRKKSPSVLCVAQDERCLILSRMTFSFSARPHTHNSYGVSSIARESLSGEEVLHAIPVLKKVYGDSMRKVLHVGPDTCSVVTWLLKEDGIEAWGIEPYDLDDGDNTCKSLVRKGIVRSADIKFSLPYRPKSFSLVITSDTVDYLTPKYLNKTLPDLARVSTDGLVIFAGNPGHHRTKVSDLPKFGRPAKWRSPSWWIRYFISAGLEENEAAPKRFEQTAAKMSYVPACQIFHLAS